VIEGGQIILLDFPQTDQQYGKLRPALVVRRCPGLYDDWLICMISSKLRHEVPGMDEIVRAEDPDFPQTGLKQTSLIPTTRLAVVSADLPAGFIGELAEDRLGRIRRNLCRWISGEESSSRT
jgi:mRNA interferase MazF